MDRLGRREGRDAAGRRVVVRAGRHLARREVPRRADDPDLLAVDRPHQPALRGPDEAVQPEALGDRPVLRERDPVVTGAPGETPGRLASVDAALVGALVALGEVDELLSRLRL